MQHALHYWAEDVRLCHEADGLMLAEYVRRRREALGLSVNALARRAGLSHTYVQKVENGRTVRPELGGLQKLAAALEVPLGLLLSQMDSEEGERGDAAQTVREDPALYAGTDSGGHAGSVPADALLREERKSLELIAKVLDTVINLEEYIEDTPSILEKWAALPPNEIILIADMIATLSTRKRFNKSGRVRRDAQPEPSIRIHREDVVTAVRVLGSSAMLLPNPEPPQLEEPRGA